MIKRVLVAGGGTGGHLFPGLAVVEELRRREPGLTTVFVGTARGIEARVLPAMGERLELIDVMPLKGRRGVDLVRSATALPRAMAQATFVLRRERPDVVIGVGGYASGPVLAAASMMGIKTAVLEQNAHVGLTNRVLAPVVGRAYVTFPETASTFDADRVRVSGNPIRRAFVDMARRASTDPEGFEARAQGILVLGGSQGARALNLRVPDALAPVARMHKAMPIVHQTGEPMVEAVRARYAELGIAARVVPFIDDVARALASASVVVARSGATTVAELCAVGRPSILVPFPHAADDHQTKNARALESRGAALVVAEQELETDRLGERLLELMSDVARRRAMSVAARAFGRPDAAANIVDDLCAWLGCEHERPASSEDGTAGVTPGEETEEIEGAPVARQMRANRTREARPARARRPLVIHAAAV